jgi:hypothetical protein
MSYNIQSFTPKLTLSEVNQLHLTTEANLQLSKNTGLCLIDGWLFGSFQDS